MKKTLANGVDKPEILERLGRLSPGAQRQWGKMTAHQMICHLIDSLRVATGERKVADRSNFASRNIVKLLALRTPMQWPHGVKTSPELDQAAGAGTPPLVFQSQLFTWLAPL